MGESSSRRVALPRRPRANRPVIRHVTVENHDDEDEDWDWYQAGWAARAPPRPAPVYYHPMMEDPSDEALHQDEYHWDWHREDAERMQRREDISDEESNCHCNADTFDRDENIKLMVSVLDKKMRKMPDCMQNKAFNDILLYIRYLRRKHRKMLLRNAEKRIPGP